MGRILLLTYATVQDVWTHAEQLWGPVIKTFATLSLASGPYPSSHGMCTWPGAVLLYGMQLLTYPCQPVPTPMTISIQPPSYETKSPMYSKHAVVTIGGGEGAWTLTHMPTYSAKQPSLIHPIIFARLGLCALHSLPHVNSCLNSIKVSIIASHLQIRKPSIRS